MVNSTLSVCHMT